MFGVNSPGGLPHGPELDLLQLIHLFGLQISFFIWNHYYPTQINPQNLIHLSRGCCKTECVIPFWLLSRSQTTFTLLSPTLTHYRSETAPAASGTGLTAIFSTGRDECGSAGAAPPWVFRAHPGGSDGNGGAGALLPTPVIIYRAWVSVGTGRWWILTRLMITLPMRVINIMKSYWACAVACDE